MAYATQDDLVPSRLSLADLTELTSDGDAPDVTVVDAALAEASATVDAYCAQRYKTPLQVSGLVKKITVDLAIFAIASLRRDTRPTETWTQNRDMAMSLLRDIANGNASLDQPDPGDTPQTSSASVTTSQRTQTFDDCNLKGFC